MDPEPADQCLDDLSKVEKNSSQCYCENSGCQIKPPSLDRANGVLAITNDTFSAALKNILNESSGADHARCCDELVSSALLVYGDSLDYDLISPLYQRAVFLEQAESHRAIHALRILQSHEKVPKQGKNQIQKFFEFISADLVIRWNLFKDFNHASTNRHLFQCQESFPDTASALIRKWPQCFLWLLSIGAIHPEYFNSAGQSFFYLAICSNEFEIARTLISNMRPEQLLDSAAFMASRSLETVLQMCVMYHDLFLSCWDKLEAAGFVSLRAALDDNHCAYICRFADAFLATKMRHYGVDLSRTVRSLPHITWVEIAEYNPNPVSLFDWLCNSGCFPYSGGTAFASPLLIAARNDRVDAVDWLLYHYFDFNEQLACATEAASRQTENSVLILAHTINRISLESCNYQIDWLQQIFIAVIHGISTCSSPVDSIQDDKTQSLAVQKLEAVRNMAAYPLSCSKEDLQKISHLNAILDFCLTRTR